MSRSITPYYEKRLINNSPSDYFVIDVSGKYYRLDAAMYPLEETGYWLRYSVVSNGENFGDDKFLRLPTKNNPVFIEELGCLVFETENEAEEAIKDYGGGKNLVLSYLNGEIGTMFGYNRTIVNMSHNDYFVVDNDTVIKIPRLNTEQRERLLKLGNINEEQLIDNDLLFIYSNVQGNKESKDINVKRFNARWVKKFNRNEPDPIILDDYNIVIFNNTRAAEDFIKTYNSKMMNYMAYLADKNNREEFQEKVNTISKDVHDDKVAIAKTAMLVAGSGAIGAFVKWVLDKIFVTKEIALGCKVTMSGITLSAKSTVCNIAGSTLLNTCFNGGRAILSTIGCGAALSGALVIAGPVLLGLSIIGGLLSSFIF
jgi:hypothetical protein